MISIYLSKKYINFPGKINPMTCEIIVSNSVSVKPQIFRWLRLPNCHSAFLLIKQILKILFYRQNKISLYLWLFWCIFLNLTKTITFASTVVYKKTKRTGRRRRRRVLSYMVGWHLSLMRMSQLLLPLLVHRLVIDPPPTKLVKSTWTWRAAA